MKFKFLLKCCGLCLIICDVYGQVGEGNEGGLRPSMKPLVIPKQSTKVPNIDIPQQPSKITPPAPRQQTDTVKIVLDTIQFDGQTVFSSDELNELAKPYLHRPVSMDELDELRRLISHHYIDNGYITSGATFPENPIQGKTLHIKIIEGRVGEIHLQGTEWLRDSYVKNRLIPDQDAPLNMNELQDKFRLLLADPLFDHVSGRLLPGAERGVSLLDLEVVRARPYQFSATMDNYRSPSIGANAVGANGWLRNLTGQGDVLDLSFLSSEPTGGKGLQYFGTWVMPLGDYGTKAFFSFNKSNTSIIEEPLASLNIRSNTFSIEGGLNQTLIDEIERRLTVGVSVGFKENETFLLNKSFPFVPGQAINGKTQVSFVRLNQEYIERWEKVVVAFRSTFSVGLDSFGATITDNKLKPDSNYFAWLGQMQSIWQLPYFDSSLVLRGNMQFSNDPLLPLERMSVGGRYTVRGYRENQLVRDNGYAGSAELHIPLWGNPQAAYRFDLVPFIDYGAAWNNADVSSNGIQPKTQALYSTGIGFQFYMPHFSSELFWGHRLKTIALQQHGDLQDDGIHFQARVDLF